MADFISFLYDGTKVWLFDIGLAIIFVFVVNLLRTFKRTPWGFFWILLKSFFKSVIISWKNFPKIWREEFKRIHSPQKNKSCDVGQDLAKYG